MAKIEVTLPQMGEGIIEATITRWLVDLNTQIEEDEPLVEIATDKVDSEIPAPVSGTLVKQFFSEGEIPKIGEVIAILEDGSAEPEDTKADGQDLDQHKEAANLVVKSNDPTGARAERRTKRSKVIASEANKHISPFIRQFSRARGISLKELAQISGTGTNGLLTKHDVYSYIKDGRPFRLEEHEVSELPVASKQGKESMGVPYQPADGEEVVEIDRTRSLIAQHMVKSVQTAPHVTSFVEADVTALVQWRESIKNRFKTDHGISFTYTPVLVQAVIKALKEYPDINVSLLPGNKLVRKSYYNIGIATALPDGNLIVPVIKNADRLSATKLALDIAEITSRARIGKLNPGDTNNGTFTITNLGLFGNISGTPIINQPESAILAVGAIKKKPGVVNSDGTLTIGIRDIMTLSLSYDHRIVDGALGGAFLSRIGQLLEEFTAIDL